MSALRLVPLAVLIACSGSAPAASDARPDAASIPTCTASLGELLVDSAGPGDGSEGYAEAPAGARSELSSALGALADGRIGDAGTAASRAGYALCALADAVILVPTAGAGRARIALRPGGAAGIALEAPHPYFDTGTGTQAVELFERLNARAVIVSGTHRCANGALSGCDGTTSVCGGSQYPVSDMAHTTESAFQAAHQALAAAYPDAWFVSLHGKSGDGTHVSDGTREPAAAGSRLARVTRAAAASLAGETIRTCNQVDAFETTSSLCGTTNVQGRHLNGSPDACTTAAPAPSDRFLHLEQSRAARDRPEAVAAILEAVFDT